MDCHISQLITLLVLCSLSLGRDRPPVASTDEPQESGTTLNCLVDISCTICIYSPPA